MQEETYLSWGRYPRKWPHKVIVPTDSAEFQKQIQHLQRPMLTRGLGRSYGDSCLNENGYLISTQRMSRFLGFDEASGILRCESGVTVDQILREFVSKGWFLPVTPGTKFVTVGGAIANDVHGKNHHKYGSFGNQVVKFALLRSDGSTCICSDQEHSQMFSATIGGMGLTGCILWAEIQLKPIRGPYIDVEAIKFQNLREFAQISQEKIQTHEYTVAWLDVIAKGPRLGRGVFISGDHSRRTELNSDKIAHQNPGWKNVPLNVPGFVLNSITLTLLNQIYFHKQRSKKTATEQHYDDYFYPLDGILNWNRMYGLNGFLQWQCVVPPVNGYDCIENIVSLVAESRYYSSLAVLKEFGNIPSKGMMSFSIPGITLSMDFRNTGPKLFDFLTKLDELVVQAGGRIYPAKDARMSGDTFRRSYSKFQKFTEFVDPNFSSSFYQRICNSTAN